MSLHDPHIGMSIDSVTNKAILSYLRDGRYQHPGEERALREMLLQAGWNCQLNKNIDNNYLKWYETLLVNLEKYKAEIVSKYGEFAYQTVHDRYYHIYSYCKQGYLGGAIIYAEPV